MSFLKFLTNKYGCNKPILSNEIEYEDYSKQQVYKELSQLTV